MKGLVVKIELNSWNEWEVTTNWGQKNNPMTRPRHPALTKEQAIQQAIDFDLIETDSRFRPPV